MIEGILHPLITPFTDDGEVDEAALLSLLDGALEIGVHGFFLLGSQGQGPTLTYEERARTAAVAIRHVKGRVPVIIHVGTTDLRSTAQLAQEAEKAGADAIAVVPPYYYRDHTTEEIDAHYIGVAKATSLPLLVYNNEKYAGINITPAWLARLADKIPSLIGVKLSYSGPQQLLQYVAKVPDRVAIYSGSVLNLLSTAPFGVRGAINPPAILFPELAVTIWSALVAKDWDLCFEIQGHMNDAALSIGRLVSKFGRSVYQEGLRMMGYDVKVFPRWQSTPLSEEAKEELRLTIENASTSIAGRTKSASGG